MKMQSILGSSRRTLEIYVDKIFSSNEMAVKAHKLSKKNYGLALSVFVNYLIDNYSENEYKELLEKYEEIEKYLNEKAEENTVSSYIQSISAIILSDMLMNKIFDFGFDEDSSLKMGENILSMLSKEKEIDEIEKAKELIEDWLIANDNRFERQTLSEVYDCINDRNTVIETLEPDQNKFEFFGMYKNNIYYILPTKFNELMRDNGFSPNKIRKGFAEKGFILIDEINNRYTILKFYKGGNRRMVAYKLKNESEILEEDLQEKLDKESNDFKIDEEIKKIEEHLK